MMSALDKILEQIEACLRSGTHQPAETERFELKPCPSTSVEWREIAKSINAFLNTRGGIVILGLREEQTSDGKKRFVFTGYREDAEAKIKDLSRIFTDVQDRPLNLTNYFPELQIRPSHTGRVAIIFVDEMPADEKFCFYRKEALQAAFNRRPQVK